MEVISTVGRRKTSIARIYLSKGKGEIKVNQKDYKDYFPTPVLQYSINQPLAAIDSLGKYDIKVNVIGGGITGQSQAVRLAIARALVKLDEENKKTLRAEGLLTRDPRMVERKKPGLRKARKKSQFSKR